jgi:pimeloyl-ACP methyl ester carboxylesterase
MLAPHCQQPRIGRLAHDGVSMLSPVTSGTVEVVHSRPLLLVPGLGLDGQAWRPTVEAVSPSRTATVITLPGYGLRAHRDQDLRPASLAEQLLDRLRGWGPAPVLLGHSASCQVAAHAARTAPERVGALVLVGPTTDPAAGTWPRLVRRWLATARHEDPRQLPALVRQYSRTGLPTMARAMDAALRDRIDRTLLSVDCPVLVLRGRHDRICPPGWADALTSGWAPRTARTVPAGAHMVPLTHGSLVAQSVEHFLGGLDAARG